MSQLGIYQTATACGPGRTVPVMGVGGTPPYTYSVSPTGAGGSISSTGIYTAPQNFGSDTITISDSAGNTVSGKMLVGSAFELFADVIQNFMGLNPNQIFFWDQKIDIPRDSQLYIAISIQSDKPFGNSISYDGSGSGMNSIQSVNMSSLVGIDIFSRGLDALRRKEQVIMALNSTYAAYQENLNSFKISTLPTDFRNLGEVDGAAIPYRFNILARLQYFVSQTTSVGYYDTFPVPTVVTNP